MIRRIVVFRFDRNPLICRSRIRELRRLNPDVVIAGLYGGVQGFRGLLVRAGSRLVLGLDTCYASRRSGRWNWQHGDLALAAWFRDVGRQYEFDVVHLVEWDLLLAAPLAEVYRGVPADAVGLTAHTPLSRVGPDWDWVSRPDLRGETQALLNELRDRWGFRDEPYACIGVGPCFPRSFLSAYAALDVPELGHDELRLPQFARVLGFSVVDTGFRRSWHSALDDPVFNATGKDIDEATIRAELRRPEGRRAFHPVRGRLRGVTL
jgi:hypothetical protein